MGELFVLKIGGSVVTDKAKNIHTVREDLLKNIFTEIASVKKQYPHIKIILIHGAGGHIHYLAHTYGLTTGTGTDTEKQKGAIETHAAVLQLHSEIIQIGVASSLPLCSMLTDTVITQTDKKISSANLKKVVEVLEQNKIPVLYGDMVQDTLLGMSICSGDAIAAYVATLLPVTKILFATDVNGIYTDDPHVHRDATLVESLTLSQIKDITLRGSHNTDTTDGLRGKITACAALFDNAPQLTEIHVFNGMQSENYSKVLLNINFPHSCIQK